MPKLRSHLCMCVSEKAKTVYVNTKDVQWQLNYTITIIICIIIIITSFVAFFSYPTIFPLSSVYYCPQWPCGIIQGIATKPVAGPHTSPFTTTIRPGLRCETEASNISVFWKRQSHIYIYLQFRMISTLYNDSCCSSRFMLHFTTK